jgi:hypothetical protein
MRELTKEERDQLEKDLEWKLKRVEEETKDLKDKQALIEHNAKNRFKPFAEYYNAARDYFYKKLPTQLQRRGDFDTMEVRATVTEDFKLALIGVWGARHATVSADPRGYVALIHDKQVVLNSDDDLYLFLIEELLEDHPVIQEAEDRCRKARKYLEQTRQQAGLS